MERNLFGRYSLPCTPYVTYLEVCAQPSCAREQLLTLSLTDVWLSAGSSGSVPTNLLLRGGNCKLRLRLEGGGVGSAITVRIRVSIRIRLSIRVSAINMVSAKQG